jgi:DNA repair protein RadC
MPEHMVSEAAATGYTSFVGDRVRLRTRLRNCGEQAFADCELLEVYLIPVVPRQDTKPVARRLMTEFGGDLCALFSASRERLMQVKGVGDAVACHLVLVGAFIARTARQGAVKREVLSSWTAVVEYCKRCMQGQGNEQFRVLFLDRKNRLMRDEVLGEGTVDHAPVYPREVVRRALELKSSALILVHNHPSGDPTPSTADIEMTKQIVDATRVLDIAVHDHLIVGREGHVSLRQLGLM